MMRVWAVSAHLCDLGYEYLRASIGAFKEDRKRVDRRGKDLGTIYLTSRSERSSYVTRSRAVSAAAVLVGRLGRPQ
jgi:hypothetical protein